MTFLAGLTAVGLWLRPQMDPNEMLIARAEFPSRLTCIDVSNERVAQCVLCMQPREFRSFRWPKDASASLCGILLANGRRDRTAAAGRPVFFGGFCEPFLGGFANLASARLLMRVVCIHADLR